MSRVNAVRTRQIEDVFHAALERPPADRATFLGEACAGDGELRAEVESLLAADDQAASFIESPALGTLTTQFRRVSAGLDLSGRRIGEFELVRVLASGGMGTVYEAVQQQPRRTVALKVLRLGIDSPSAFRRFEYEAQILAHLRHPAIAQVYAAGTHVDPGSHAEGTGASVPYIAMELVPEARTIVAFGHEHGLPLRRRLELFARVCDAVQYGHQNGIIHRDLKPGNILVDPAGDPKVIDFGVARANDSALSVALTQCDAHQMVGTLQYMSPEQCDFDPDQVDTRSDVYSLGVVLYELLCEALPYDVTRSSLSKAAQMIREQLPRRPSGANPALRGDVETIVLKALEKERERRYASAADLARDIRKFLANRPIEARPPSRLYHVRKLVARHKAASALSAMLIGALVGFSIWMTSLYGRSDANLKRAQAAERNARTEADTNRAVSEYLVNLFQTLDPTGRGTDVDSLGGSFTVRELLDREVRVIPERLKNQPLTQATLLATLSGQYVRLELFSRAAAAMERALELRREATAGHGALVADTLYTLADVLRRKGELGRAWALLEEARAKFDALPSRPVLENRRAQILAAMAMIRRAQADTATSVRLQHESLAMVEAIHGPDDPTTDGARYNLASVLDAAGEWDEAEARMRQTAESYRVRFGANSSQAAAGVHAIGLVLRNRGELDRAEATLREALRLRMALEPPRPADVATTLSAIAGLRKTRGDFAEAKALSREALAIYRTHLTEDSTAIGGMLYNLASLAVAANDQPAIGELVAEAAQLQRRAAALPPDHLHRSGALLMLGVLRMGQGDATGAEDLLRECVASRGDVLSPEHWLTAYSECVLARSLIQQARYAEAEPLLGSAYPRVAAMIGHGDDRTIDIVQDLITVYETMGQTNKAATYNDVLLRYRR